MPKTQEPDTYTYWDGIRWDDPQQRTGATGVDFTLIRGKGELEARVLLERRLSAKPTIDEFRQVLRDLAAMLLDAAEAPQRISRRPPPTRTSPHSS
jgi:hypothetical protein